MADVETPHLVWDDALYATGVPEIDSQHKNLFERLNDLLSASRGGKGHLHLSDFFQFLAAYATQHFSSEEKIMDCRSCRARGINRVAHATFREHLTTIRDEFQREGPSEELASRIQVHLCDWFRTHIERVDTQLRRTSDASAEA